MSISLRGRSVITLDEFTSGEIGFPANRRQVEGAKAKRRCPPPLSGRNIALLCEEGSMNDERPLRI